MCLNPLACQWNMESTTRLSLNLVLHLPTITNIASQQLSLLKYSASWMSTSKELDLPQYFPIGRTNCLHLKKYR